MLCLSLISCGVLQPALGIDTSLIEKPIYEDSRSFKTSFCLMYVIL